MRRLSPIIVQLDPARCLVVFGVAIVIAGAVALGWAFAAIAFGLGLLALAVHLSRGP